MQEDSVCHVTGFLQLSDFGDNCFIKGQRRSVYFEVETFQYMGNRCLEYDALDREYCYDDSVRNFALHFMDAFS